MESMTGYGTARRDGTAGVVTVQIASVNNRQCRVAVRSDLRDLELDERCRGLVTERLKRGSITVQITWDRPLGIGLDVAGLRRAWTELAAVATEVGAPAPRLEQVARLLPKGSDAVPAELSDLVLATTAAAAEACVAMRVAEGGRLQLAMQAQVEALAELRQQMAVRAADRVPRHRDLLEERVRDLLAGRAGISEEQLLRECAVYADRIDITEEVDRLDSHLDQLRALLQTPASGKRIEFLLQECGREVNTTGSKANDADLQGLVVEAKSLLDQLREQAANVL